MALPKIAIKISDGKKRKKLMKKGHNSASSCFKRRFTSYFHQLKNKSRKLRDEYLFKKKTGYCFTLTQTQL